MDDGLEIKEMSIAITSVELQNSHPSTGEFEVSDVPMFATGYDERLSTSPAIRFLASLKRGQQERFEQLPPDAREAALLTALHASDDLSATADHMTGQVIRGVNEFLDDDAQVKEVYFCLMDAVGRHVDGQFRHALPKLFLHHTGMDLVVPRVKPRDIRRQEFGQPDGQGRLTLFSRRLANLSVSNVLQFNAINHRPSGSHYLFEKHE